jgi:hypothetical protein
VLSIVNKLSTVHKYVNYAITHPSVMFVRFGSAQKSVEGQSLLIYLGRALASEPAQRYGGW